MTATKLRQLIESEDTEFLMEAHSPLSARIAEESGFKALWASGLSISASLGVSDRNEASWTEVLGIVEAMADRVSVPILMDGDSGFGNFNNVRRVVRHMSKAGVAGICLEDKLFPKANSFVDGPQELASVEEFRGKIMAAKDSQLDPDFVVVARTEALICGAGRDEALCRANRYDEAGADAILIHSKQAHAGEIMEFARRWERRRPLIIVPTTYSQTPTDVFKTAGIACVIWANHSVRASVSAMRRITSIIHERAYAGDLDHDICTVDDIFRLTNEYEVRDAERRYLAPGTVG